MQIFNTLTRQKEDFVPQEPGVYRIYVCGPTVYNYIHIGNARPLIVFDTLRRYLEYRGNKVIYVSNITDIDDKLITRANEEGTTMKVVAERFEAEYKRHAPGVTSLPPPCHPPPRRIGPPNPPGPMGGGPRPRRGGGIPQAKPAELLTYSLFTIH